MLCFRNNDFFLLFWEPLVALVCYSFHAIVDAEQATDFQRLRHVTVNPNRCYSLTQQSRANCAQQCTYCTY